MKMLQAVAETCLVLLAAWVAAAGPAAASDDEERPAIITSAKTRLDAWEERRRLSAGSPFRKLPWRQVGPRFQGGRIESIVGVPGNPAVIYAAAGSGGVWKTLNGGLTWQPIFDDQPTLAIGDIELQPGDPNMVWVGTGESLLARSSYPGVGVFRSDDGGRTWENKGLNDSNHIGRIAISPDDHDVVYVAAMGHARSPSQERGLFMTTDGGDTWDNVLFVDSVTGVSEVVIDPSDADVVFAASWSNQDSGAGSAIYRSVDSGRSWKRLSGGFPDHDGVGRIGLDIALTNPAVVYAVFDHRQPTPEEESGAPSQGRDLRSLRELTSEEFLALESAEQMTLLEGVRILDVYTIDEIGELLRTEELTPELLADCLEEHWSSERRRRERLIGAEVYRSDDAGETWRKTHDGPFYLYANHGWSFGDIRVSPVDEDEIYVLGVTLQRSTDGGRTFSGVDGTIAHILRNKGRNLHLDQHDLWIDPRNPDRLLIGNDGGIYTSLDRGRSWLHHNTLPLAEFYHVSIDTNTPYRIYGGTQDNASLYGPGDHDISHGTEDPWQYVWLDRWSGGDGSHTLVDPDDADVIYYKHGAVNRKNMRTGVTVRLRPRREICAPPPRFGLSAPLEFSSHDSRRLYLAGNRVFVSDDKGDAWEALSEALTPPEEERDRRATFSALSESALDPDLVYAGTGRGEVHVTKDGGDSWRRIDEGLPERAVRQIVASRHEKGRVYVCSTDPRRDDLSSYVYASEDYGATWRSITGNLPTEAVESLAEDPKNPDIVFAGTYLGVYVTLDSGRSWISLNSSLPALPVATLHVQPREAELVVGTHGRSVYVMDISPIREYAKSSKEKAFLVPVKAARLPRARDYEGDWDMETIKKAHFVFHSPHEGSFEIEVKDAEGETVWTREGEASPGMNSVIWDLAVERERRRRSAYASGTSLAAAGTYDVRLRLLDEELRGSFEIEAFPRPR